MQTLSGTPTTAWRPGIAGTPATAECPLLILILNYYRLFNVNASFLLCKEKTIFDAS
jgi:hypothetical protein